MSGPAPGRSDDRRRRGLSVALVGADGAGKSTVTSMLAHADLPRPVRTIYMGVNLEASTLMLPTTRALLAVKRARGGRPDLVGSRLTVPADPTGGPIAGSPAGSPAGGLAVRGRSTGRSAKNAARLAVWALEEWLRQLIASVHQARGRIVVFDRHFFADYYHADIAPTAGPRTVTARLHGAMLRRLYPKPDLVLCLDAPAEVLYARKPEASVEWLEHRRQQYLALAPEVPAFAVVDATQPVKHVLADVVAAITRQLSPSGTSVPSTREAVSP